MENKTYWLIFKGNCIIIFFCLLSYNLTIIYNRSLPCKDILILAILSFLKKTMRKAVKTYLNFLKLAISRSKSPTKLIGWALRIRKIRTRQSSTKKLKRKRSKRRRKKRRNRKKKRKRGRSISTNKRRTKRAKNKNIRSSLTTQR